jgi:hypothetical protein
MPERQPASVVADAYQASAFGLGQIIKPRRPWGGRLQSVQAAGAV